LIGEYQVVPQLFSKDDLDTNPEQFQAKNVNLYKLYHHECVQQYVLSGKKYPTQDVFSCPEKILGKQKEIYISRK